MIMGKLPLILAAVVVLALLGVAINIAYVEPAVRQLPDPAGTRPPVWLGRLIECCAFSITMIFPVILFYFMTRPHVRAAFGARPSDGSTGA